MGCFSVRPGSMSQSCNVVCDVAQWVFLVEWWFLND